MMKEKRIFQPLTSKDIYTVYNILCEEGLISLPLTQDAEHKIDAIVANINGDSFGTPHYSTVEEKVVAHFYFIVNDHAFTDGNKRTATLVFRVLCRKNGLHEKLEGYDLDALAVFLEQSHGPNHQAVIKAVAQAIFDKK